MEMNVSAKRPIGLAHFSAIDVAPLDFITLAAEAGFDAVGLRLSPAFAGAPFYTLKQGSTEARAVKSRLAQTGISVFDIEFVVIDEHFDPQTMLSVFEDAADLGAKRISVCGQDSDFIRFTDRFVALCETAVPYGLSIDLENMGWRPVNKLSKAVQLVQASGAPNAGVLVDAIHLFRNNEGIDTLKAIAPRLLSHAQLCDVRGANPQTDDARVLEARAGRYAPGEGELPLSGFIQALPAETRISLEVPVQAGREVRAHLRYLRQSLREGFGL